MPEALSGMVNIAGMNYPVYRLFVIGLALLILVFMMLLLYRTRLGKIVRAAVSDRDMVNALGININLVFMFVFGVGTWMAGIAGVAIAPILTVFPGLAGPGRNGRLHRGRDRRVRISRRPPSSFRSSSGFLSSYGVQFISQFAPVLMVVFMAIVLAFRPNGLFGVKG